MYSPVNRRINATRKEAIVSAVPWPYGCLSSAGFLLMRSPTRTIPVASTSSAEFRESASIALLFPRTPADNLTTVSRIFTHRQIFVHTSPSKRSLLGFSLSPVPKLSHHSSGQPRIGGQCPSYSRTGLQHSITDTTIIYAISTPYAPPNAMRRVLE